MTKNAKPRVLIVEDEKALSHALNVKLSREGIITEILENGSDAVAALKKNKYDLVLLDLMLPRLGGFGVLEELNDSKIKTKVIIISNLSQAEDVDRAKKLGAIDFIVKSDFSLAEIVAKVKANL